MNIYSEGMKTIAHTYAQFLLFSVMQGHCLMLHTSKAKRATAFIGHSETTDITKRSAADATP